jgi:DNA-binding GntR family transcriptional regulator
MVVRKTKLSDQVYDALKQDILNQIFGFGEKVTNRDLQERYGVSSTPVRDAINRLYHDGFLDKISTSGARIISFDFKIALEVIEVMSMLNREALSLSMKYTPREKVILQLKETLDNQLQYINDDSYFEYDRQFHQLFFDFCGNARIRHIYSQHGVLWLLLVKFYYADKEMTRDRAVLQHQHVFEAYRQGDIPLALRYIDDHFNDAIRPLSRMLARNKETGRPLFGSLV